MLQISEYVSLGHPDKIADYISSYLLDRFIEQDPETRYAVEVQIKDNQVTLGGEVASTASFTTQQIADFVGEAVAQIGYTDEYQAKWGKPFTIGAGDLGVRILIGQQSRDISRGVYQDGWGDQGIFFGYAEPNRDTCGMPLDHTLAKRLCKALFESEIGGLDIKTQVEIVDGQLTHVVAAVPLLASTNANVRGVEAFVRHILAANWVKGGNYHVTVNGTGAYIAHSSIADCGTTGRKLAVDFYGGNCRIGGGSPWTKDASKADLSLNLMARLIAKNYAEDYDVPVNVSLACCIGKPHVRMEVNDLAGNTLCADLLRITPSMCRRLLGLDKPIYASMCRWGLFGEYQADKAWENTAINPFKP